MPPQPIVLTFENLIARTPFVPLVKKVLAAVQAAYGRPVDMEFAWDDGKLYVLQCRSLSTRREIERVAVPLDTPVEDRLFLSRTGLCSARVTGIEYVVYVDPRAYDRLASVSEKRRIGWAVVTRPVRVAPRWATLLEVVHAVAPGLLQWVFTHGHEPFHRAMARRLARMKRGN